MKDLQLIKKQVLDQASVELNQPNVTPETVEHINSCVQEAHNIVKKGGEILCEAVQAVVDSEAI